MADAPLSMEALDFRYLLLEYYKKLGIDENSLAVILMIDHLSKQNNNFITADILSLKMNLKVKEIDAILANLLKREFLSYDVKGKDMCTTLEPLRQKIYNVFQLAVTKDKQNLASEERSVLLQQLYSYFEKRLKRTLSPIESDMFSTWLDDGYSLEEIESALEESIASGKKTFKVIDRNLRTYRRRGDIDQEGYSSVDDDWDKDLAKTIEIANTKWLDDDE
ncbi:MAG: DnaD domain protein [Bacilli bacterium]|jgi:DnaD/phage-associated family protein|nr:DnaD domain protein [Bacilli bacterium]